MKILIDVDKLEQDGVFSSDLAAILRQSATRDTGSAAINMLLAFGAIAMAAGLLVLVTSASLALLFGLGFIGAGYVIAQKFSEQWGKLGHIWMIIGTLITCGALGVLIDKPLLGALAAAAILAAMAVLAQSHLLIALVPLALGAALGGSTGYWHATYEIGIEEPTLTILLFSVLGLIAWQIALRLKGLWQALGLTFARVCVILVNFGFWIGSLWGDSPGKIWKTANADFTDHEYIPAFVFAFGWLVALVLAGLWGAREGRRFMVNSAATFGAIHFYTQWFEYLGAKPLPVIVAGSVTIAFGLGLWHYNKRVLAPSPT